MPTVQVTCPSCSQRLSCDDGALDQPMRCPRCSEEVRPVDLLDREVAIPALPLKAEPRRGTLVWGDALEAASDGTAGDGTAGDGTAGDGTAGDGTAGHDVATTRGGTVVLEAPDEDKAPVDSAAPKPKIAGASPARVRRKTTIGELSSVAERLRANTVERLPSRAARQILIASAAGLTAVVLAAMALATGSWRWLLGVVAFLALSALLAWLVLRLLPWLAARAGNVELPGRAWIWLAAGGTTIAAVAAVATWSLSEATASLAGGLSAMSHSAAVSSAPVASAADDGMKRDGQVAVAGGILFVPPSFHSDDGAFNLLLHFHGNPELVKESTTKVGLNALVHITNLGVDSTPYERAFVAPAAFDNLVSKIVERAARLGLRDANVRRIAISSWSAGYGGLYHILRDPVRFERVDALLLMDGLHFRFVDEVKREVDPLGLEPFVRYAEEAVAGRKLFVLTHSAVRTPRYASTTETADHLLAETGVSRREVDPDEASPPKVSLDVAVRAFPREARRWLVARSEAHEGQFQVLGYAGHTPEDHMAHLIQMSVTVLPILAERWR